MVISGARATITKSIVTSLAALYNQLWRHHQNVKIANKARCRCVDFVFFIVIYGLKANYFFNDIEYCMNCWYARRLDGYLGAYVAGIRLM